MQQQEDLEKLVQQCGSIAAAARELGIPRETLRDRLRKLAPVDGIEIALPVSSEIPIEQLVAQRIEKFERKREHEESRKLIPVTVKDNGPIGILHFGDPHVDDDGTDLKLLQMHAKLVATTPGMYGANVGDTTNNWVGRLAKLYASQGTTAGEAWRLAEWFLKEVEKWLYVVSGNHDAWSGAGDPLQYITRNIGAYYADSEARVALKFKDKEVRINCRHDFAGSSMYNPAHGPMKALAYGLRDHIAISGHKHESAYGLLKCPDSGITMHAIKVASYKTLDRYAREKGFKDQTLSPCCVTVIDPSLPGDHPDLVKVFWDPEEGADYLTWKRSVVNK